MPPKEYHALNCGFQPSLLAVRQLFYFLRNLNIHAIKSTAVNAKERKMKLGVFYIILLTLFVSSAQAERPTSRYGGLTLKTTGIANAPSALHDNSELKRNSGLFSLSYMRPFNRHFITIISAKYDLLDYQWTAPSLFEGAVHPFGYVKRYGADLKLMFRSDDGWTGLISPSIQYAYAEGANSDDARSWGVVATAMKMLKSGNTLGIGIGYFNDINKVRTIPFLAINWNLNEQWSIANPFNTGFSGPAGLELKYKWDPKLEFGLGSSKRSHRFLVATENIGTIEINEWVSFLRAGYDFTDDFSVNAYLGYIFSSEIEFSRSDRDEHIDNHLGTSLSIKYKF